MADTWIISVLVFNTLLFGLTTSYEVENTATTDDGKYITQLKECSLKLGDAGVTTSRKGGQGDKGTQGPKGEPGDKGNDSPTGQKGDTGSPGGTGLSGLQGAQGPQGNKGDKGGDGSKGDKGVPGPRGDQGIPGLPGSCPCTRNIGSEHDDKISEKKGQKVCKEMESVTYDVEIPMGPWGMKVTCNKSLELDSDDDWTCLIPLARVARGINNETPKKPFWLSSQNITLQDIYGVTRSQLAWIQARSYKAIQEIKYHCINSAPYDSKREDQSLILLSSNDVLFGKTPQESSPFVYDIPSELDECSKPGTEPRSSVIRIEWPAFRLPVVDFYIRDLSDKISDIGIEHIKLCFL